MIFWKGQPWNRELSDFGGKLEPRLRIKEFVTAKELIEGRTNTRNM